MQKTMSAPWAALGLALALVLGHAGQAQALNSYDACLKMVTENPALAEIKAAEWRRGGGGAAAGHCRALALMALGANIRAAKELIDVATNERMAPDSVRATMLVDAGTIYLEQGLLKAADEAAKQALRLAKNPRDALTLTAQIKAERKDWNGAIADLSTALAHGKPDGELLAMRASAKRRLNQLHGARLDLDEAAKLAPDSATVWLETGALDQAVGDWDKARKALLKAVELDRKGPVGDAARLRIQKMDGNG